MGKDPSGPFITSLLELKLDKDTMFEWQKASQDSTEVPHYNKLFDFLNLRAQASETSSNDQKKPFPPRKFPPRTSASHIASAADSTPCVCCKLQKHPLYACPQFKSLTHDNKLSLVRSNNLCINCLRPGHFARNCVSNNKCRKCQQPHHTQIHNEGKPQNQESPTQEPQTQREPPEKKNTLVVTPLVPANAQPGASGSTLLMTCQVLVNSPDGSQFRA